MTTAALVGIAGYTGQELARFIVQHPHLDLIASFGASSSSGQSVAEAVPALRGIVEGVIQPGDAESILGSDAEVVFLATPHEASAQLTPTLLEQGRTVVDLSAAFRLTDASQYPVFYGFTHPSPTLLDRAIYGLPERYREALSGSSLIAVPGCYPTSVIVPVAPLVDAGLIDASRSLIVDSTSGVSGAGRKPTGRTAFCEVSQSPYGVFTHRHGPEIDQYCGTGVIFTPHLGPYDRGICSTIHADLTSGVDEDAIRNCLADAYAGEQFVRLLPAGIWPTVSAVQRTNMVDIGLAVDARRRHLIVVSCIDNLVKGASGQAVQALNAAKGWDESLGLPPGATGAVAR